MYYHYCYATLDFLCVSRITESNSFLRTIHILQCVGILLKHGADPMSFRTQERGNLLHFAVECASLIKQASDEHKDTSLCLRQLVEQMALYLDETDANGNSLVFEAFVWLIHSIIKFYSFNGGLC